MIERQPLKEVKAEGKPPEVVYASEGAVRQDGPLKVYLCAECHREVVWVKSKSGKNYPAEVFRGYKEGRYYVKASPHSLRKCKERQEQSRKMADLYRCPCIIIALGGTRHRCDKERGHRDGIHSAGAFSTGEVVGYAEVS